MPGLPRVLLIGDSISIGYTLEVRKLLAGKANLHRIAENGGPTRTYLPLPGSPAIDKGKVAAGTRSLPGSASPSP